MNFMKMRPFLVTICTAFVCSTAFSLSAEESIPFPEVAHVEKAGDADQASTDLLPLMEYIGNNPDDAYLHRIHNDAYYHLVAFSDNGDIIQLHDASKWAVHPAQMHTVLYWVQSDNIFIKPRSSCYSNYKFVLQNYTTQQAVEVNLISPPLPMGAQTFRITNIEPNTRMVLLSDNTVWQVDAADSYFPYWQIGQRILIGLNNQWRVAPLPNILINVDLYGEPYSQANFFGYPVGN